jgi:hypothetical protein
MARNRAPISTTRLNLKGQWTNPDEIGLGHGSAADMTLKPTRSLPLPSRQVGETRYLRFAAFPSQNLSHHLPPDCLHAATHFSMEKPVFVLEVL